MEVRTDSAELRGESVEVRTDSAELTSWKVLGVEEEWW